MHLIYASTFICIATYKSFVFYGRTRSPWTALQYGQTIPQEFSIQWTVTIQWTFLRGRKKFTKSRHHCINFFVYLIILMKNCSNDDNKCPKAFCLWFILLLLKVVDLNGQINQANTNKLHLQSNKSKGSYNNYVLLTEMTLNEISIKSYSALWLANIIQHSAVIHSF